MMKLNIHIFFCLVVEKTKGKNQMFHFTTSVYCFMAHLLPSCII
jgi:hypothetical protein